jgi:hypothetical protein
MLAPQPSLKDTCTADYIRNVILPDGILDAGTRLPSKPFGIAQRVAAVRTAFEGRRMRDRAALDSAGHRSRVAIPVTCYGSGRCKFIGAPLP